MSLIESTKSYILDIPPSCIAFCPSKPKYFVVGTYLLHQKVKSGGGDGDEAPNEEGEETSSEAPQIRSGSLILYQLEEDEITPITTTATPHYSILDIQWYPHNGSNSDSNGILAVAGSTGCIAFYSLDFTGSDAPQLNLISEKSVTSPEILVLSLCWHPSRDNCLAWTLSDGSVCLCESATEFIWDPKTELDVIDVQQHSLEAWMVAFGLPGTTSPSENSTDILSGGDDMIFQLSRVDKTSRDSTGVWQDRRLHQAGVTAILPLESNLILTGSYDDHIRLLSTPSIGRRQILAEHNLEGGVWRLKLLSDPKLQKNSFVILASCMHAGARVVRLSRHEDAEGGTEWTFEILARFEEHKSMNYGSDVQPVVTGKTDGVKRIVSISFYDKLMCLWKYDTPR